MYFSVNGFAAVVVIDPAAIAQQITQITHALQQIRELQYQLETANKQLDRMSGSRGLGDLVDTLYDPDVVVVIDDVLAANGLNSGDINGLVGATKDLYNEANNDSALFKGQSRATKEQAQERFDELLGLIAKVDNSPDQKDVLDLQARVGAESVMLQNELVKLQAIRAEADANKEINKQKKIQALISDVGVW